MNVIITGGLGFIGRRLTARLLERGYLLIDGVQHSIEHVVLVDPRPDGLFEDSRVRHVSPDALDEDLMRYFSGGAISIFHLASTMSLDAESGWANAVNRNVGSLVRLVEVAEATEFAPVVVFASSVAAGTTGTYGVTKLVCEQLLADASRVGVVDGRSARLPTVIVRSDPANGAASGFASAIFRDALSARPVVVPVPVDLQMLLIGASTAVESLILLHDANRAGLPESRLVPLRGLTASVRDLIAELRAVGGASALDHLSFTQDQRITALIEQWPTNWDTSRAVHLGLPVDAALRNVIAEYLDHSGLGPQLER